VRARKPERELAQAGRAIYGTRSRIRRFVTQIGASRVPEEFRGLHWLSVVIVVLLLIQLFTGILLSLYYYPEPGVAYDSLRHLISDVPTGWLVRGVHSWAADLTVIAVVAHLLHVFFRRAYRFPREYEWVVGVFLLPAVLAFRFTGRLLPWDAIGYEAARGGLNMLERVPAVGSWAARWLRGGEDMGTNTLSRFFTTHVLILPWLVMALLALHIHLVRRHKLMGDEVAVGSEGSEGSEGEEAE
jgi:quinol-cytochrome oxidoreductase complex cytochrome b subunit